MKSVVASSFLLAIIFFQVESAPKAHELMLALTGLETEMVVTWVTSHNSTGEVKYGTSSSSLHHVAKGKTHTYTAGGWEGYIHNAKMVDLTPNKKYYYKAEDSAVYSFMSPKKTAADTQVTIGAFGDHGHRSQSQDTLDHMISDPSCCDLVFLAGDISYANGVEKQWDVYGDMVQPFTAKVPWMVAVGNHEYYYHQEAFKARFRMPGEESGSGTNDYQSYDYGPAHLVAISSENEYAVDSTQYKWIKADLQKAHANRANVPWVIVYYHRPMYSSNQDHGSDTKLRAAIEPLFLKYKVDLAVTGHVHAYERTYPVAAGKRDDRNGIPHITVGTGGNHEGLYKNWNDEAWSAKQYSEDWGFAKFTISRNSTYSDLHWQFHENTGYKLIDEAHIYKKN